MPAVVAADPGGLAQFAIANRADAGDAVAMHQNSRQCGNKKLQLITETVSEEAEGRKSCSQGAQLTGVSEHPENRYDTASATQVGLI